MSSILLNNIRINDAPSDLLISGERIARIVPHGEALDIPEGCEKVDCTHKAAFPAFINMHTHSGMSLMRGIGEDMKLEAWLDKIWRIEDKMDENFIYWSTKVAAIEMLRTGTATFNDQYWYTWVARKAAEQMGLRPAVAYVILDRYNATVSEHQKEHCLQVYEDYIKNPGRSLLLATFHSVYTVSEDMILWISEFARSRGLKLHFHLSESTTEVADCKAAHGGLSPVEYLDALGVLDENCIAAHTLQLSPHDTEILGSRRVTCVHNVNSNLKLSSGYRFLYKELKEAGANVCIGTDGAASSNNLDMLEAMKTTAIVQKAWRGDPTALPLNELMNMATLNGAKALGIDSGVLREGALADIQIVDTDNTFFLSPASDLANFIYSAHSDCITDLICGGRFAMRNKEVPGEKEILAQARQAMKIL